MYKILVLIFVLSFEIGAHRAQAGLYFSMDLRMEDDLELMLLCLLPKCYGYRLVPKSQQVLQILKDTVYHRGSGP